MVVASPKSRPEFRFHVVLCSDRLDVPFERAVGYYGRDARTLSKESRTLRPNTAQANKYVQDFERRASEQPFESVLEAWANTLDYRRFLRRRSVELCGLDVGHYGSIIFSEVLVPAEEEPSSWEDITPFYGSAEAITFAVFPVTCIVAKIQCAESSFAPC